MDIPKHRKAEVVAQIITETVRDSRQLLDDSTTLLDKIKRTISQLEQNLCLHCNKDPSDDCDICQGYYKVE